MIESQTNRNLKDLDQILCVCGGGSFPQSVVEEVLPADRYKRLKRLRLSRKIDENLDAIWCPNLEC